MENPSKYTSMRYRNIKIIYLNFHVTLKDERAVSSEQDTLCLIQRVDRVFFGVKQGEVERLANPESVLKQNNISDF